MRVGIVVAVIAALGGTASAEDRGTTFSVGGVGTLLASAEQEDLLPVGGGGLRLTLGFENLPLPLPEKRGARLGASLVPELVVGALLPEDRAEVLVGAGLRGEIRISQREGGLLRINSRCALYLAARGMIVGEDRDVMLEGVFGTYVSLSSPFRWGFEVGVTHRETEQMSGGMAGAVGQFYVGWGLR